MVLLELKEDLWCGAVWILWWLLPKITCQSNSVWGGAQGLPFFLDSLIVLASFSVFIVLPAFIF